MPEPEPTMIPYRGFEIEAGSDLYWRLVAEGQIADIWKPPEKVEGGWSFLGFELEKAK